MMALAFLLYLLVFYVLPWHGTVLFQWVWTHAPQHFPWLMLTQGRHLLCNGAFYAEMWLWWLIFAGGAAVLEWMARKDDPAWEGLFRGFDAETRRVYALLGFLAFVLVALAMAGGYAPHGLLSLILVLLTTLTLSARGTSRSAHRHSASSAPAETEPPDTVPDPARALRPEDFPAFDPEALAQRVRQAVAPETSAGPNAPFSD